MDWLVPTILIVATAVVLVLCTRAVKKALRADRDQSESLPPPPDGQP